ncbi:hypothetical protein [Streptomyces griseoaurantiacus]|uniref:hypothetical protein n=1 Tax=Streptomyces griseoaurantiacus TaxID=68213 RepID=UPI0030E55885
MLSTDSLLVRADRCPQGQGHRSGWAGPWLGAYAAESGRTSARDEAGRRVVVEAQYGPADHRHLGRLLTYGRATGAALAVWVVADLDPVRSWLLLSVRLALTH